MAITNIGGKVEGEIEMTSFPSGGVQIAPNSSYSVEYKNKKHELIIYYDKDGNVHSTKLKGPFSVKIKQLATLP